MHQHRITTFAVTLAFITMLGAPALTMGSEVFKARMTGFQEVPPNSTPASGTCTATISDDDTSIAYELTYEGLEAPVTQAHIHFGQFFVSAGIVVFLCQTDTSPDPSGVAPACPQSGTVSGTINATNIVGPLAQGINPGEFAKLLDAMRRGETYANVHSQKFPAGEIRGQLIRGF
jgi:hypothetical protein